jgi:ABC-2 type transport system ATP-binding protein
LESSRVEEVIDIYDNALEVFNSKVVVDDFDHYLIPNTLFLSFVDAPSITILEKIEGVVKVEEIVRNTFRIYFSEAQEVIDRIVEQSTLNHWRLSEIRIEKNSFDSIFAELSKKAH